MSVLTTVGLVCLASFITGRLHVAAFTAAIKATRYGRFRKVESIIKLISLINLVMLLSSIVIAAIMVITAIGGE